MNYIAYTARFLYRIKWWLILAPTVVALAVFFKMGAQPRNYKSMTTVYTGIVSGYDITTTEGTRQDWNIINNAMDNLINIILSQSTLKNVSMRLYAQGLTHLDPDNDNPHLPVPAEPDPQGGHGPRGPHLRGEDARKPAQI